MKETFVDFDEEAYKEYKELYSEIEIMVRK